MGNVDIVKQARESTERKFKQTFDLAINLKNTDFKKPENKIKTDVVLPNGFRKATIGVFADDLVPSLKDVEGIVLIKKDEIDKYSRDKKSGKKLARTCYAFLAEASLMPAIGKSLGQILAPRNKMPKPIPPTLPDIKPILSRLNKTVFVAIKNSPVIHCAVGNVDMSDEEVVQNIDALLKIMIEKLPKGIDQIKNVYVKTTMGKSFKIEVK